MPNPDFVNGCAQQKSLELFERAKKSIPGGVNSPVRAFASVGSTPPLIAKAQGCHLITEDGAKLVDYVGSWGPAILGHAHPEVVKAVQNAAADGLSFGASCAAEIDLAELLCEMVPSLRGGQVRLVSSGTEATMSALRLARGFTGREKIVKLDGGYHGHADFLLVAAGSGAATLGLPGSEGVTKGAVKDTLVVPYNDVGAMEELFAQQGQEIAAVIVEPVCGNIGCVPPKAGYLQALREITQKAGALLIFDEVMTGFRVAMGGAQARFGVTPDLTCLGKIVGGGMPVGAYGGRADVMAKIAPTGPVYQAGTLSGNPLSVAAGYQTLRMLKDQDPYPELEARCAALCQGIAQRAEAAKVKIQSHQVGSMFGLFFCETPVWNYDDAKNSNTQAFAVWHKAMLSRGVYLAPSQFEAGFLSMAHDERAITHTLDAAQASFEEVAQFLG